MPFTLANPLPMSMASECRKCGKILASFADPRQALGPEKVIPPSVLAKAKGLAILSVLKAGFLGSGRFGSGVVVARLPDGRWSAPSAIITAGGGFGGQIGFELTEFVFILNDSAAVRSFAQMGSVTLGGNVSIAAGPVGRNAEAAGAASLKSVSGIFAYSKTKGLFAGVSLEGSVIAERRDANEKMYGRRLTAQALLEGQQPVPPAAAPLMQVLNSRAFAGQGAVSDAMYNDIPVYDDRHDDVVWQGDRGSAYGEGVRSNRTGQTSNADEYEYRDRPTRSSTWNDDVYDRAPTSPVQGLNRSFTAGSRGSSTVGGLSELSGKSKPARPTGPKPVFGAAKASLGADQVRAKFAFEADQPGDLGFKKGEIITIVKKTDKTNDWWTGRIGSREGTFPANYLELD